MGVICYNCKKNNNNIRVIQQPEEKIIRYGNEKKCYTSEARIIKRPNIGEDDYIIKITGKYNGDHLCNEQLLLLVFNYPVTFISCNNGTIDCSNNTTRLNVKLKFHNNKNDTIEIENFLVKCAHNDLEIINCIISESI